MLRCSKQHQAAEQWQDHPTSALEHAAVAYAEQHQLWEDLVCQAEDEGSAELADAAHEAACELDCIADALHMTADQFHADGTDPATALERAAVERGRARRRYFEACSADKGAAMTTTTTQTQRCTCGRLQQHCNGDSDAHNVAGRTYNERTRYRPTVANDLVRIEGNEQRRAAMHHVPASADPPAHSVAWSIYYDDQQRAARAKQTAALDVWRADPTSANYFAWQAAREKTWRYQDLQVWWLQQHGPRP